MTGRRRGWLLGGWLAAALLAAGCGGGSSHPGSHVTTSTSVTNGTTTTTTVAPGPAGRRDSQDPARRDHHAGEPLVRHVLRHLSRAPTASRGWPAIPDRSLRPRSDHGDCVRPYPRSGRPEQRRPPRRRRVRWPTSTAARWTASSAAAGARHGRLRADVRRRRARAGGGTPDVMGYHTGAEIPNYWAYAHDFVLQDHMFEPVASWSLPAHLYMVSEWSAYCTIAERSRQLPQRHRGPETPPDFAGRLGNALRPARLRLDRPHLPAPQGQRQLGATTSTQGTEPDCDDARDDLHAGRRSTARTPGIWNPLP